MKKCSQKFKKFAAVVGGAGSFLLTTPMNVFATTGIGQVDNAIAKTKLLGIGIVSAIGIIVLIKGGLDLGSAFKDRDTSGMATAGGEMIGGFIMAAIGPVLAFLGF